MFLTANLKTYIYEGIFNFFTFTRYVRARVWLNKHTWLIGKDFTLSDTSLYLTSACDTLTFGFCVFFWCRIRDLSYAR